MEPMAESIRLPEAYGKPSKLLFWPDVEARLIEAMHYWLATARPDGRPHVVPVDGIWHDGACYFGGDPATVHERNLRADSHAVIHLDDSESATIVEGRAERHAPSESEAEALASASKSKCGYAPPPAAYRDGVWRLVPVTVLAWNVLYEDATRFRFAAVSEAGSRPRQPSR